MSIVSRVYGICMDHTSSPLYSTSICYKYSISVTVFFVGQSNQCWEIVESTCDKQISDLQHMSYGLSIKLLVNVVHCSNIKKRWSTLLRRKGSFQYISNLCSINLHFFRGAQAIVQCSPDIGFVQLGSNEN
jgi:hypothetical protein